MIIQNGSQLCTGNYASYQWFLNGILLQGATQACYSPVFTGSDLVSVEDSDGCQAESDPIQFDPNDPFCQRPTGLFVNGVQTNRTILRWDVVTDARCYQIRGNRLGSPGFVELDINDGAQTEFSAGGLQPGTSYFWQMRACCDAGKTNCSGWSPIDSFSTSCPTPDPVSVTNITTSSARINWSPKGGSTGYEVRGRQLGGNFVRVQRNGPSNSGLNTGNILLPATTYEVQVFTNCDGIDQRNSPYTPLMQ